MPSPNSTPHLHDSEGHSHGRGDSPPVVGAIATAVCGLFALTGWGLAQFEAPWLSWASLGAFAIAYLAGGAAPTVQAFESLRRGHLNVDLLMVLAAAGAASIGDWAEGSVLLFLFSLSGVLEAFAIYRTTRSIEALIQLRPREASLVRPGAPEDERVSVESLEIGNVVRVRPGERFPIDGEVHEGETWADEATLTGESEQIHKSPGDKVFAGTINGAGSVLVQMTKAVADTTLARIVHLVQEAQAQKTPAQRFLESWQRPYVLGVLAASLLVFIGARLVHTPDWSDAFYHAMVLLVAASPCAVVVSSPAVMLSAIARAARLGILFKGAAHLETLGVIDIVALDKTGTITVGKPAVTEIWTPEGVNVERLLGLAAAVELRSEHPLATPVLAEAKRRGISIDGAPLRDFNSHTGLGVHGRVAGTWIGVGREPLFESHDVSIPEDVLREARRIRKSGQTALLVLAVEESIRGVIALADLPRPEAAGALAALKQLGIFKIVILTGDHEHVARAIAEKLGADDVRAGLRPEQKVVELRRLMEGGRELAMVGDGVNDAPALAVARVGIAMSGGGTDVALETADVVLMRDDLRALPLAVWLSRRSVARVRQNLIFSFGMIGVLVLSTFLDLPLWLGVLGHEGSTVLVVLNGLRLLWEKTPEY